MVKSKMSLTYKFLTAINSNFVVPHAGLKNLVLSCLLINFLKRVYVVVNFLFQLIFIFPLFWGMVMYANEFKTKEKQKLTEIKN